jgi:hypothetical protein
MKYLQSNQTTQYYIKFNKVYKDALFLALTCTITRFHQDRVINYFNINKQKGVKIDACKRLV